MKVYSAPFVSGIDSHLQATDFYIVHLDSAAEFYLHFGNIVTKLKNMCYFHIYSMWNKWPWQYIAKENWDERIKGIYNEHHKLLQSGPQEA